MKTINLLPNPNILTNLDNIDIDRYNKYKNANKTIYLSFNHNTGIVYGYISYHKGYNLPTAYINSYDVKINDIEFKDLKDAVCKDVMYFYNNILKKEFADIIDEVGNMVITGNTSHNIYISTSTNAFYVSDKQQNNNDELIIKSKNFIYNINDNEDILFNKIYDQTFDVCKKYFEPINEYHKYLIRNQKFNNEYEHLQFLGM